MDADCEVAGGAAAEPSAPPPAPAFPAVFARLSASRGALGPLCAFAGGALPATVLSTCGSALLPFLDTRTVLPLRATCHEARLAAAAHPWVDLHNPVPLSRAGGWAAAFPAARAACAVSTAAAAEPLPARLLAPFAGLRELRLWGSAGELAGLAGAAGGGGGGGAPPLLLPGGGRLVLGRVMPRVGLTVAYAQGYRVCTDRPENQSGHLYEALRAWLQELALRARGCADGAEAAADFRRTVELVLIAFAYVDRTHCAQRAVPHLAVVAGQAWAAAQAGTLRGRAPGDAAAMAAGAHPRMARAWLALGMQLVVPWVLFSGARGLYGRQQ